MGSSNTAPWFGFGGRRSLICMSMFMSIPVQADYMRRHGPQYHQVQPNEEINNNGNPEGDWVAAGRQLREIADALYLQRGARRERLRQVLPNVWVIPNINALQLALHNNGEIFSFERFAFASFYYIDYVLANISNSSVYTGSLVASIIAQRVLSMWIQNNGGLLSIIRNGLSPKGCGCATMMLLAFGLTSVLRHSI